MTPSPHPSPSWSRPDPVVPDPVAELLDGLPPMDVAGRLARLRGRWAEVDALLIADLINIRYLTGFTGSAGLLVVGPDAARLVTDGRYTEQSAQEVSTGGADVAVTIASTPAEVASALVRELDGHTRCGFEADVVTVNEHRRWVDEALASLTKREVGPLELVATTGVVAGLRLVKEEAEVARIRAAAAVADAALESVRPLLGCEPTEARVAAELDYLIRCFGASGNSFETIVASGPNGAKPHARPGSRRVSTGDLVVIDFGAVVDGYCSDMTRTFLVGQGTEVQRRMLEVVTEAQAAGVAAVCAGRPASEVDRTCRDLIDASGWGAAFSHSTGHGVGLLVHEQPRVSKVSTDTLAAGQIVTVEPGVYLPEHGGVRIEDTVVVTGQGCTPLTLAPKEPVVASPVAS